MMRIFVASVALGASLLSLASAGAAGECNPWPDGGFGGQAGVPFGLVNTFEGGSTFSGVKGRNDNFAHLNQNNDPCTAQVRPLFVTDSVTPMLDYVEFGLLYESGQAFPKVFQVARVGGVAVENWEGNYISYPGSHEVEIYATGTTWRSRINGTQVDSRIMPFSQAYVFSMSERESQEDSNWSDWWDLKARLPDGNYVPWTRLYRWRDTDILGGYGTQDFSCHMVSNSQWQNIFNHQVTNVCSVDTDGPPSLGN